MDEPTQDDERALVDRAKAGDLEAQDELVRRHFPGVHAWIRLKRSNLVAQRETPTDLAQSVFRVVIGDLDKFEYRGPGSFRNWVLTYATHKVSSRERYYRAARRSPECEVAESVSHVYGAFCSPSEVAQSRERFEQFERAFAELSARDQELVLLARVEGVSHAELAQRYGTTEAASRQALRLAIVRLAAGMARKG